MPHLISIHPDVLLPIADAAWRVRGDVAPAADRLVEEAIEVCQSIGVEPFSDADDTARLMLDPARPALARAWMQIEMG